MQTNDLLAAARAEAAEFREVRAQAMRSRYFHRLDAVARHTDLPDRALDLCAEVERLQGRVNELEAENVNAR